MKLLKRFLTEELNIELSREAEEKFSTYRETLKKWNKKINLTSIEIDSEIEKLHFIDSLHGLKAGISDSSDIIDIGSGAGFPGIPIKIIKPLVNLFLAESAAKKCEFLKEVVRELTLENVEILNLRSEELPEFMRESFDFAICRALAKFPVAAELSLPWVKLGGKSVFYLKKSLETERYRDTLALLGGELSEEFEYNLPGDNAFRKISIVKKISAAPSAFPRRPGMAKKRPLTQKQ